MGADEIVAELEAVYRSLLPKFTRAAVAITGDEGLGADAVHDAFVTCVRDAADFRSEGTLEAWVWRSVVNSALRVRRDRKPDASAEHDEWPGSTNGHGVELASVRAALSLLPERQRLVLFLRYYADLDYRRVAETLGVSIGTVGAALNQAHASLRATLTKEAAE